jgi:hypothetical protein
VDDDSRIINLLWTTGKGRAQYHYFGDAITFDTTYRTNVYDMPFGLIVGVTLPECHIRWYSAKGRKGRKL